MFNNMLDTLKGYKYSRINVKLLLYVICLTIIGILSIGSATPGEKYQSKQIFGMILGLVMLIVLMLFSYKFVFKFYWLAYFLNIALLVAVLLIGDVNKGAGRWIDLKFFQFQPAEFSKIFLILFLAVYIEKHINTLNTFKTLASAVALAGFPMILIFLEPDLSTTIVIFVTFCAIMFLSGVSYKIITGILVILLPIGAVVGYVVLQPDSGILEDYQYKRIEGWLTGEDDTQWQQENSILAIGSGGLTGKGLYNNTVTSVKNGNLLSESHTDFIFTIVGEELGFAGSAAVVILLLLIILECFITGAKAPDISGRMFCYGFGCLIAFQAFVNIAVATMILPNTGLTLPFVSYGLTSLLSMFCGAGIVMNVGLQRKKDLY